MNGRGDLDIVLAALVVALDDGRGPSRVFEGRQGGEGGHVLFLVRLNATPYSGWRFQVCCHRTCSEILTQVLKPGRGKSVSVSKCTSRVATRRSGRMQVLLFRLRFFFDCIYKEVPHSRVCYECLISSSGCYPPLPFNKFWEKTAGFVEFPAQSRAVERDIKSEGVSLQVVPVKVKQQMWVASGECKELG